jgi:hypothetical protein
MSRNLETAVMTPLPSGSDRIETIRGIEAFRPC